MQTDLDRGQALDTVSSKRTFESYATAWMVGRTDLRPKTQDLYTLLLRRYLLPHLGEVAIGKMDPPTIDRWHSRVSEGDQSAVTTAKALGQVREYARRLHRTSTTPATNRLVGTQASCGRNFEEGARRARPRLERARRCATLGR